MGGGGLSKNIALNHSLYCPEYIRTATGDSLVLIVAPLADGADRGDLCRAVILDRDQRGDPLLPVVVLDSSAWVVDNGRNRLP